MLRKEADLSMKRYAYSAGRVGEGLIVESPAARVSRVRDMAFPSPDLY
jgi:hypothetical protein